MIVTRVGQLIAPRVLRVLREQQEPRGRLGRLEVEEVSQDQLVSVGLRVLPALQANQETKELPALQANQETKE